MPRTSPLTAPGCGGGGAALKISYMHICQCQSTLSDQGGATDPISWGEAVRLEPLVPDSGALGGRGNQAFSAGPALGSAVSRRITSLNGPHIPVGIFAH